MGLSSQAWFRNSLLNMIEEEKQKARQIMARAMNLSAEYKGPSATLALLHGMTATRYQQVLDAMRDKPEEGANPCESS